MSREGPYSLPSQAEAAQELAALLRKRQGEAASLRQELRQAERALKQDDQMMRSWNQQQVESVSIRLSGKEAAIAQLSRDLARFRSAAFPVLEPALAGSAHAEAAGAIAAAATTAEALAAVAARADTEAKADRLATSGAGTMGGASDFSSGNTSGSTTTTISNVIGDAMDYSYGSASSPPREQAAAQQRQGQSFRGGGQR